MSFRSRGTILASVGIALVLAAGIATVANASDTAGETGEPGRIPVNSAEKLKAALAAAKPGDTIELASGSYEGAFKATAAGTADAPITLIGSPDSVLSNGSGYGLHLDGAAHWKLSGFSVSNAKKGIVLDSSNHVVIDNVEVAEIGEEGVHFRTSSSDNVLRNSRIHDTGLTKPEYGEAVYFGSAKSNWDKYGDNGGPDRSDRNQALNNKLGPNVTAEHIDVKEGTEGGVIRGNTFDGQGISGANYADSWVDVKGNAYLVEGNTGTFNGDGALLDGYQTHRILAPYGCGNMFRGNISDLGGASGYAIKVEKQDQCAGSPNVVYADNTVTNAGKGLTNIDVTD
jgi:nitrous oxidase accessory protein NosD